MAIVQRFETDLSLKGASLEAFALSSLMPIQDALILRGLLPGGAPAREGAWVHIETWTYLIPFSLREEAFERYELYAPYVLGSGEVVLNGHTISAFSTGELRADLTAHIQAENMLKFTFRPEIPAQLTAPFARGIIGGAMLRGSNYITLSALSNEMGECVHLALRAHIAGRYNFTYAANGEKRTYSEKLRATDHVLAHALPCTGGAEVKLTIERGGTLLDEWLFHAAHIGPHSPWFALDAQALVSGDFDASAARELNLPAVFAAAPSLSVGAIDGIPLEGGESACWCPGEDIGTALLRGVRLRVPPLSARSSEYLRIAARARLPHAFVLEVPVHQSESQTFPVYFAGDARAKYPLSVSAVAYDQAGRALASCAFAAMGDGIQKLGEIRVNMSGDLTHLIVRVSTTGFVTGESAIIDHILSIGAAPAPARLLRSGGRIKNESDHFAEILVFGNHGYYGALLPGESIPGGEVQVINGEIRGE